MDFWEILSENWVELLGALGTVAAILFGTKKKRTPEEKQAAAEAKQAKKSQRATAKLMKAEAKQKKAMEKAQTEAQKLLNIQGGKS